MSLYHEMHVTIEFPGEHVLPYVRILLDKMPHWHMGDLLLMKNEDERSHKDLFFTSRADTKIEAWMYTLAFCSVLRDHGFKIVRYKLEDTVVDSRINDEWKLLQLQSRRPQPTR